MSNELIIANRVIFRGGQPVAIPSIAADPGTAINGDLYYNNATKKVRAYQDGAWVDVANGGTINSGSAGQLAIYPSTGNSIDDAWSQNAFNLSIGIEAQPTRSAPIQYVIPNPGDGVTNAKVILSRGIQELDGDTTFTGTVLFQGTTSGTFTGDVTGTAANITGTLAITHGGTGQTTKTAAFDALSPMSAVGDILYGGTSGTGTRLAKGIDGKVLTLVSGLPSWETAAGVSFFNVVPTSTTPYSATSNDVVLMDASGGAKTINLPASSGISGRTIIVKKVDSSGNMVTIDGNASETIDGALTQILSVQYESLTMICDGSNWQVV